MTFVVWILVGALVGWLASVVIRTVAVEGLLLNAAVGGVGALVGGEAVAPMFRSVSYYQSSFSLTSLGVACLGSIVLLIIANLIRRLVSEKA